MSAILCLLVLAYLAYLLWHSMHLPNVVQDVPVIDYPSVAVIVPVRNEADNILYCLQALLLQDYPADKLQIIVIDDHSTDATLAQVGQWANQHEGHAYILQLPEGQLGKKAALAAGIASTNADIILTTDADTLAPAGWVWRMVSYMQPGVVLVAGPIKKTFSARSVFGRLQALESAGMLGLSAAAIGAGQPTLCNGANLAFRKTAYLSVGGYDSPVDVASGDDELLLHKILHARLGRIVYATHADAVVATPALGSLSTFVQQRLRWVSKSRAYRYAYMTASQLLAYVAHLSLLVLVIWACADHSLWAVVLPLIALKMLADTSLTVPALRLTGQQGLVWWLPLAQLWHIPYVVWVGLAGNLVRRYSWKGRRVR